MTHLTRSINDYGIEGINSKSDALFNVVKGFIQDGVPVDAIGFQCHLTLGQVPPTLQANLQRFADLGLDVAITELDINMRGPSNATALAQQAKDYYQVVDACVQTKRCVSVVSPLHCRRRSGWMRRVTDGGSQTVWGVSDDHSWIPNGQVLPWDANKNPKPAFFGIADAFQGKPSP